MEARSGQSCLSRDNLSLLQSKFSSRAFSPNEMQDYTIEDRPEREDLDWIFNPSAPRTGEELLQFINDEVAAITAKVTGKEHSPC